MWNIWSIFADKNQPKYYIMRKLLIFLISVLFFTCSEDKEDRCTHTSSLTRTISSEKWTFVGGKDTYVLGERLGIRISTGEDIPTNISSFALEMKTGTDDRYVTIASGYSTTLQFEDLYAFKLGLCYIKGTVYMDDGQVMETEVFDFKVMGPLISDLIEKTEVKKHMSDCWDNTKSSEEANSRREFGFVVQMKVESEKEPIYSFSETTGTPSNDCTTGAVNTIQFNIDDIENNTSASYSVALFHTHPPLTNCPSTSSRETGPSDQDNNTANDNRIPSVVLDYGSGGIIYGGHNRNSFYTLSYAGNYTQKL